MMHWIHPPERDRDPRREPFDPALEGARHGLPRDLALALWQRVCAEATDPSGHRDDDRARRRFHQLAARLAARGGRLRADPGRLTRVATELEGAPIPTDALALRVPGRVTLVGVELDGAPATADALAGRVPGRTTLVSADARRRAQLGADAIRDANTKRPTGRGDLPGADDVRRALVALGSASSIDNANAEALATSDPGSATAAQRDLRDAQLPRIARGSEGGVTRLFGHGSLGARPTDASIARLFDHGSLGAHPTDASIADLFGRGSAGAPTIDEISARRRTSPLVNPAIAHVRSTASPSARLAARGRDGQSPEASRDLLERVLAILGAADHGAPLPSELAARMTAALAGTGPAIAFDHVRVHTDDAAAEAAELIGAQAFTVGHHIYFARDQFAPGTEHGDRLLRHELTHVAQHARGELAAHGALDLVSDSSSAEAEARAAEARQSPPVPLPWPAQAGDPRLAGARTDHAATTGAPVPPAWETAALPVPATSVAAAPAAPADAGPLARKPQTGAPKPSPEIKQIVDRILKNLKGVTFRWNSNAIVEEFQHRDAATVQAIINELKHRAPEHGETPEGMVRWLLGDLTAEDRRKLESILSQRGPTKDVGRVVADNVVDLLRGWTTASDSHEILKILKQVAGARLDQALVQLEQRTGKTKEALGTWLFGDLTREDAERLRQHFFTAGGPRAVGYASRFTAGKIESLLRGYTSHADSSSILWNLKQTPDKQRTTVLEALERRTQLRFKKSAEDALMESLDKSDYEALQKLPGVKLRAHNYERSATRKILSVVEWGAVAAEVIVGGVIGIVTGLISILTDIVGLVFDLVVAAKHLVMSLLYFASGGLIGSADWLATKEFFKGLGTLFTNPGEIFSTAWEDTKLGSSTIEGTFEHGRRAQYWTHRVTSFVTNVVLIVKGVAKGVSKLSKKLPPKGTNLPKSEPPIKTEPKPEPKTKHEPKHENETKHEIETKREIDPRSADEARNDPEQIRRFERYRKTSKSKLEFREWWDKYGRKSPPNPHGKRGNRAHQDTVDKLVEMARKEFPNDDIIREESIKGRRTLHGKKIPINRQPDVTVLDRKDHTIVKKVYEAARTNKDGSFVARELAKKKEYKKLKLDSRFERVQEK